MDAKSPLKVYFTITWSWKRGYDATSRVYCIQGDYYNKLRLLFRDDITWVTSGDKYDMDAAIKKLAELMEKGSLVEKQACDLIKGGDYCFPLSFKVTVVEVTEL
jgi:hypothetical protein